MSPFLTHYLSLTKSQRFDLLVNVYGTTRTQALGSSKPEIWLHGAIPIALELAREQCWDEFNDVVAQLLTVHKELKHTIQSCLTHLVLNNNVVGLSHFCNQINTSNLSLSNVLRPAMQHVTTPIWRLLSNPLPFFNTTDMVSVLSGALNYNEKMQAWERLIAEEMSDEQAIIELTKSIQSDSKHKINHTPYIFFKHSKNLHNTPLLTAFVLNDYSFDDILLHGPSEDYHFDEREEWERFLRNPSEKHLNNPFGGLIYLNKNNVRLAVERIAHCVQLFDNNHKPFNVAQYPGILLLIAHMPEANEHSEYLQRIIQRQRLSEAVEPNAHHVAQKKKI